MVPLLIHVLTVYLVSLPVINGYQHPSLDNLENEGQHWHLIDPQLQVRRLNHLLRRPIFNRRTAKQHLDTTASNVGNAWKVVASLASLNGDSNYVRTPSTSSLWIVIEMSGDGMRTAEVGLR